MPLSIPSKILNAKNFNHVLQPDIMQKFVLFDLCFNEEVLRGQCLCNLQQ